MCDTSSGAPRRTSTRGGIRLSMVSSVARISVREPGRQSYISRSRAATRPHRVCPWESMRRTSTIVAARGSNSPPAS